MGTQPFGAGLEPVLQQACEGRLSPINWFRTDWQRGGALTGYANYRDDDGRDQPVVVKLPVPPVERVWLGRLQSAQDVAPRLYAHGEALGGYDMAWVVMERLPHGPLGAAWNGQQFDLLIEAAGRFYQAAQQFTADGPPPAPAPAPPPAPPPASAREKDWEQLLQTARQNIKRQSLPDKQRWSTAMKKAQRKSTAWLKIWSERPLEGWCHGDLHLANALTRNQPPDGPALLIDYALTRPGHWVQDAVYLEHLHWSRSDVLGDRRLCRQMAHERKRLGLKVDKNWSQLAQTYRALVAMTTPAALHLNGTPAHLQAALKVLEAAI